MTEPRGPIDAARQQQTERKLLDQMNDRELARLYERAEKAEAALEQAKRNQLGDFETISYWTHQTHLARDYAEHDSRALAATVVQARRWAARARAAEAVIARVRETAACWEQMPSDRHVYIHEAARTIRAALDESEEPTP